MRRYLVGLVGLLFALVPLGGAHGAPLDTEVVVVGGPQAVSESVLDTLETCTTGVVRRVSGDNRYGTAAAVFDDSGWPAAAWGMAFASGEDFPDALSGSNVPYPMLLTRHAEIPAETQAVIDRYSPGGINLVGGTAAVSASVEQSLADQFPLAHIWRMAGSDRYETAAKTTYNYAGARVVYVASGETFPDALAAAAAESGTTDRRGPLLLTKANTVPYAIERELVRLSPQTVVIVGGPAAISDHVGDELYAIGQRSYTGDAPGYWSVTRIAGTDRYGTAAAISAFAFPSGADRVVIATGTSFPDALVGSMYLGSPVLLVNRDGIPSATATAIERLTGTPCR